MIPPDVSGRVASQAAQILIQRGLEPRLSVDRMVVAYDRREPGIVIDAPITSCCSFGAVDDRVRPVKQLAPRHITIFDDAPWIVWAGEQVRSAHHSPPSVCQCRDKESQ